MNTEKAQRSKTEEVIEEIVSRYKAAYPIIWVKTEEYARTIDTLQKRFREENKKYEKMNKEAKEPLPLALQPKKLYHWDAINGLVKTTLPNDPGVRVFPPPAEKGKMVVEPTCWQHILAWGNHLKIETVEAGSIIFVNGFHNLLAAAAPTEHGRMRAALLQIIQPTLRKIDGVLRKGLREEEEFRTVIMVGPKPDHPVLSPDVLTYLEVIDFPRPTAEEIRNLIEFQLGELRTPEKDLVTKDKELVLACSKELRGTTVFQSENALSLTYVKRRRLDQRTLRQQYKAIMELHPALSVVEYKETWEDLIGFENYKRFVTALLSGERRELKGILFVGIPGGGKSHAAKATGAHFGLKTIFCNLGRVFNKFIGNSEENTESLFRSIDACGESIIYMDEIEKGLGGMGKGHGGDGGVSDRVMQQVLTWMNDHDSGAFVIATANDPHILPPELLREGRWDCIFNVPPPTFQQRVALATLYGNIAGIQADTKAIAQRTKDWVGAEIKGLMHKAQIFRKTTSSDEDAIETAFEFVRPMNISDPERFRQRVKEGSEQGVSANAEDQNPTLTTDEPAPRRRALE